MTMARADKQADLAGPGIGNYEELEKILPQDYRTLLPPEKRSRPSLPSSTTSRSICVRHCI
jgi:hypothetical protein